MAKDDMTPKTPGGGVVPDKDISPDTYHPPVDNEEWDDLTEDFHKFVEKNDSLQGQLVNKGIQDVRGSEVGRYTLLDLESGKRVSFLGGVSLDQMFDAVQVGDYVKVVYMGKVKTGSGNEVKNFKIYRRKTK